jgi:flagellar hook-associated protein 2
MSGISSGVGIFSGINRDQIIQQLLAIDARPKVLAQQQIAGLQKYQAAFLDVTGKANALRTLAQTFRTSKIFQSARATSSNADVLKATAANGAPTGQYSVTAARLASTQQVLSRGLSNSNVSGVGLSQIVVEDARGLVDPHTPLSELNGGDGVQRGKIQIQDRAGATYTVDLTRVTTVTDVIEAINQATGGRVKASVGTVDNIPGNVYAGQGLRLDDSSGGAGSITVTELGGTHTGGDLGIAGTSAGAAFINGTRINYAGRDTRLSALNDGLGVGVNGTIGLTTEDFQITARNNTSFKVDIGDIYTGSPQVRTSVAATTLGEVVDRINSAAGNSGKVTASINSSGRLVLTDNTGSTASNLTVTELNSGTSAADLGILGSAAAPTLTGNNLIAKLNSVSTQRLLGGTGLVADPIRATAKSGEVILFDELNVTGSVVDFVNSFNNDAQNTVLPGGHRKFELSIDQSGTRFILTDNTTGVGSTDVTGGAADALGLSQTSTSGVIRSDRTQRQYINANTQLANLNGGRGVGLGTFQINTSTGRHVTVNVTSSQSTVGDLISQIRTATGNTPPDIDVALNDSGDGIVIREHIPGQGANLISVSDVTGAVARNLNLAGTATASGASNFVNGTAERVITLNPADTLEQVRTKINDAGAGVTASIINDGGANPYRLSLSSRNSGRAGALSIDTGTVDLGLTTVSEARDALVFYGSSDPSHAVAIESSSNSVTNAVPGVTLDLLTTSDSPITIGVTTDNDAILKAVHDFVDGFNSLVDSIDSRSKYDADSNTRGDLLGDSTSAELRRTAQDLMQRKAFGVNSQYQYAFEVGLKVGQGGKLELDEAKLQTALENDPAGVADMFAGRAQAASSSSRNITDATGHILGSVQEVVEGTVTMKGIFEIFADEMDRFTRPVDGSLNRRSKVVDDKIKSQNDRIAVINQRLTDKQSRLQAQFIAMEQAIGQMQSQSSSLSSITRIT